MSGPLKGLRIVEFGGLGPGPFAAMLLADHGAEVIRIDRPGELPGEGTLLRNRKLLPLDLRDEAARDVALRLASDADGLIEGFRPGVMERLGLGPEGLLALNPRLVYARMTGWGQSGPLASSAGHDINYIALSGALHTIGPAEAPVVPPALLGDFGGGGMYLAFAMTSALVHAQKTGEGQVVDCAIVDGAALLTTVFHEAMARDAWRDARAANLIDGGAPFYGVYRTADDKFVSIGALEPKFYDALITCLGLKADPAFADQMDRSAWPQMRTVLTALFRSRQRDEWCQTFDGFDTCFAPVLSLSEAPHHVHALARMAYVDVGGVLQPAGGPRYSLTPIANPAPGSAFE